MVPERFEYVSILLVLLLFVASAYSRELQSCLSREEFWLAFPIYFVGCTAVDLLAIHLKWWTFQSPKIVGVYLITIPVEEYLLFVVTYLILVGVWESQA